MSRPSMARLPAGPAFGYTDTGSSPCREKVRYRGRAATGRTRRTGVALPLAALRAVGRLRGRTAAGRFPGRRAGRSGDPAARRAGRGGASAGFPRGGARASFRGRNGGGPGPGPASGRRGRAGGRPDRRPLDGAQSAGRAARPHPRGRVVPRGITFSRAGGRCARRVGSPRPEPRRTRRGGRGGGRPARPDRRAAGKARVPRRVAEPDGTPAPRGGVARRASPRPVAFARQGTSFR